MPERVWTKAQLRAINERGRTLLVSAAAGSGKTTTLTERIIQSICDRENPSDISKLLVVTFTRAAAADLKSKISAALSNALAGEPGNAHLARQIVTLPGARISTIDSFCLDLVKSNFQVLGLSPSIRLCDAGDDLLLSRRVMNDLIDECFSDENKNLCGGAAKFADFADNFVGAREDEKLCDIFLDIHEKFSVYPNPEKLPFEYADALLSDSQKDFFETKHGGVITDEIYEMLDHYENFFKYALAAMAEDTDVASAYGAAFVSDADGICRMKDALSQGFEKCGEAIKDYTPARLSSLKAQNKTELSEFLKDERNSFKAALKEIYAKYFGANAAEISAAQKATAHILNMLGELNAEFSRRRALEYRRKNAYSFNDIAMFAYRLLVNDNGEKTELAKSIADSINAVYIDEYQDVNALQDAIFKAVSKDNNLFVVGDIKQSIYAFRGAAPSLFSNMRNSLPDIDEAEEGAAAKIFMSENFRSSKPIIDFTNLIFSFHMPKISPSANYRSDDELKCGKCSENPARVKLALIKKGEDESGEKIDYEARYIALSIKKLIDEKTTLENGKPIKYSDIAILMRSPRSRIKAYETELRRCGIPSVADMSENLFSRSEIELVLCLLNAIDNPRRDVYLAGLMLSPLYGFTLDRLVELRRGASCPLWDSVKSNSENDDRLYAFVCDIEKYRECARGLTVDKLLTMLYNDYNIFALVCGSDKIAAANLEQFYDYARLFERGVFKGLYNFIKYIESIIEENKVALESAKVTADADCVRIMTVHFSKGLEYPVCFVADTAHKYNTSTEKIVFDSELGFGFPLRDKTGFASYQTHVRRAICKAAENAQREEELRMLYVALTRARERLYITGICKDADEMNFVCSQRRNYYSRYAGLEINNFLDIIMMSPVCENNAADVSVIDFSAAENAEENNTRKTENTPAENADAPVVNLDERLAFEYKFAYRSKLPQKLTVSKLYPDILNDIEDEGASSIDAVLDIKLKEPKLSGEGEDSAAKRGTATHMFLQFCDFENAAANGIENEISRMCEKRFMPLSDMSLINREHIRMFFESRLFDKMRNAKRLWREQRFNISLPAENFTSDEEMKKLLHGEKLFVQGVIDCFFEDDDGITLVDYKTDFLTDYELAHREAAEQKLSERHSQQLFYYKSALEKIFGKCVSKVLIYSLPLGDDIEIIY